MDTLSIIRGLYNAHLAEHQNDDDARQQLTALFGEIINDYIELQRPNTFFDGEKPKLLFDDRDSEWHNIETARHRRRRRR